MGRLHGAQDGAAKRDRPDKSERATGAAEGKRQRPAMAYASSVMDVQIYWGTDGQPITQIDGRPE